MHFTINRINLTEPGDQDVVMHDEFELTEENLYPFSLPNNELKDFLYPTITATAAYNFQTVLPQTYHGSNCYEWVVFQQMSFKELSYI